MITKLEFDFCVCGGGLAGICAAIAAARDGLRVILVDERSVLGGNSSSEFRVWICGAVGMGNNRYAEEGGVVGELSLENLYRNREGNPFLWDALLLDWVYKEPLITLLKNTRLIGVTAESGRVQRVECVQHTTQKRYEITANMYADCTGDGTLAVMAGVGWVHGTADEDKASRLRFEMDEEEYSLGSSILFYRKKCEQPVKYMPPTFAYSKDEIKHIIERTGKLVSLELNGCDYWWLEHGGLRDTIADSEDISFELYKIVYGLWDYIKNSGEFDADFYTLEWVGAIPSRRESRRIRARYTLRPAELVEQAAQPDAVCHGGWPIDIHPSAGFFDKRESCNQIDIGVYDIPLGSLVCRDMGNIMLAGRDAGMSHAAMASARVMKTCALMGQAAGTAAALAMRTGRLPGDFGPTDIHKLQQTLLREDVWIIGRKNEDADDLARAATVGGDASAALDTGFSGRYVPLERDVCIVLPPLPAGVAVSVPVSARGAAAPVVEVWCSGQPQNYDMASKLGEYPLMAGQDGWAWIAPPNWGEGNVVLRFPSCADALLGMADAEFPGVFGVFSSTAKGLDTCLPAVRALEGFAPFGPDNLINGYNRPYHGMNLWVAPLQAERGARIQLTLKKPVDIARVHLYLESSLNRDYNNLRPNLYNTAWSEMPPNLARDLSIEMTGAEGVWTVEVRDNRQRHLCLASNAKQITTVRLTVLRSWGGHLAAVYEMRLYGEGASSCPDVRSARAILPHDL